MPIIDEVRVEERGAGAAVVARLRSESAGLEELARANPRIFDARRAVSRGRSGSAWLQAALKRAADVAVSLAVLTVTLPLIAMVAAAIVLDSRGPVFYRAERIGRGGRPLRMLKFRKMHHNASGAPLTMAQDARFTRIGRLLARTKIDELPQLWHVLRGEMSLIGPRPEDPGFVAERSMDYDEILQVRPGITGLSQIAFADESEILCKVDPLAHYRSRIFPQKIRLDRMYATNVSI